MKKEEQAFTYDCDALIGDVENGRIGSTLSEGVRRFEEESIPQGELIFPDEVSGHSAAVREALHRIEISQGVTPDPDHEVIHEDILTEAATKLL